MPYGDTGSWAFPLVFPILFPILFPMAFMMFMMLRHGGPFGMMMMGGSHGRHGASEPPARVDDRPGQPNEDPGGGTRELPLEVAKRRYAAGEIDRKEFELIRRDIEAS